MKNLLVNLLLISSLSAFAANKNQFDTNLDRTKLLNLLNYNSEQLDLSCNFESTGYLNDYWTEQIMFNTMKTRLKKNNVHLKKIINEDSLTFTVSLFHTFSDGNTRDINFKIQTDLDIKEVLQADYSDYMSAEKEHYKGTCKSL